jgi:hypothetical protein
LEQEDWRKAARKLMVKLTSGGFVGFFLQKFSPALNQNLILK